MGMLGHANGPAGWTAGYNEGYREGHLAGLRYAHNSIAPLAGDTAATAEALRILAQVLLRMDNDLRKDRWEE